MLTAIGQGAGLAAATGIRPFLPPLLVGFFARADVGLDFDGTSFAFLEGTPFLAVMLALAVAWYILERRAPGGRHVKALPVLAALLGALLFAGTMAVHGGPVWAGAIAGAGCALLAAAASSGLLARARRRLEEAAAAFLTVWADLGGLVIAAAAIFAWPIGLVVLVPLAWVLVQNRRSAERKHEGLRTLR